MRVVMYNFNDRTHNKKQNIHHLQIRTIVLGREFDFDTQINARTSTLAG